MGWITALKSASIRVLVEQGQLQLGLFDERNLLELSSPDYPGERLVACRNPELAKLRAHKREELLAATESEPGEDQGPSGRGQAHRPGRDRRARGQGRSTSTRSPSTSSSAIGDSGVYLRAHSPTASPPKPRSTASTSSALQCRRHRWTRADCVRNYKALANVERAFRSLKTIDLKVRPIHHRLADRVRAHIFLCMLAY